MRRLDDRLTRDVFRGSLAVAAGATTWNQLRSARFTRVLRDVYVVRGHPVTHELRCRAAMALLPERAALTGRSAAVARGVTLATARDPVEILVHEDQRFGPVRGLRVRRVERAFTTSTTTSGLRVVASARMAFDLANKDELHDVVADLDAAVRAGVVDVDEARRAFAGVRERGVRRVRRAWELVDGRAESRPESIVRVLLVLAGLRPEPQVEIRDAGGFVARVDLGFRRHRVAVEYDGVSHADPGQLRRDRQRLNRLRAAGWRVVFVTADDLWRDRDAIVRDVRAALRD